MKKKVVFLISYEGYHPVEYEVPKKLLEKNGYEVITASTQPGFAIAKDGTSTRVDKLVTELDPAEYDGLVIIGGPGVPDDLYDDKVYRAIQDANIANKILGAICLGTRVLAKAGALSSRTATGWNGDGRLEVIYCSHGVIYQDAPYLIDAMDRKIVTARGPAEAKDFGKALMEVI